MILNSGFLNSANTVASSTFRPASEVSPLLFQKSTSLPSNVRGVGHDNDSTLLSPRPLQAPQALATPSESATRSPSNSTAADAQVEAEQRAAVEKQAEEQQLARDRRVISDLASRDREVRAHEQAHAAVGGIHAGAPTYQYERGPDGVNYAVAGEVQISVGKEATPEATLIKAQIVRRAALAPAEPSPQDRRVAASAVRLEAEARSEIAIRAREEKAVQEQEASETEGQNSVSVQDSGESAESASSPIGRSQAAEQNSASNDATQAISSRTRSVTEQLGLAIASTSPTFSQPGSLLSQLA